MKKKILIGLAGLVVACVLLFIFVISPYTKKQEAEFGALRAVCDGSGVGDAAAYPPASGLARLVSFERGTSGFTISNHGPVEWRAETRSNAALVLCLTDAEQELLRTCEYNGGKEVKLYQHKQKVELRAAQSGEMIAEETLVGSKPDPCDEKQVFVKGDSSIDRSGDKVSSEQIKQWLAPHVEPTS